MEDTVTANETAAPATGRAVPVSFWVIAGLSLLWNAFGGYDYVMTRLKNEAYLSHIGNPQDLIAWVDGMPLVAQIGWPIGVWFSVLGSVLLLMRSRHAVTAFAVSLVGAVISMGMSYDSPMPASLDTPMNNAITLIILVIIVFLWWFSRRSRASGILR